MHVVVAPSKRKSPGAPASTSKTRRLASPPHSSETDHENASNYVLKVSSDDDSESPLAFLYFLDSGGGSYPEVISPTEGREAAGSVTTEDDGRIPGKDERRLRGLGGNG
ncbi:hypothetical protein Droror1_Dr00023694 [Drosera rotundifolia]